MQLDAAAALAARLMERHGLTGWELVLDNAKTRAGVCRHDRKQLGLSRPLTRLHPEPEVRETILHEIAHALVGPRHGHDAVWAAKAREIGGSGRPCVADDAPRVPGEWVGVCPAGHEVTRHRRPERVLSCPRCSPRFDERAVFTWSKRGVPQPMSAVYLAELDLLRQPGRLADGVSPPARTARALLPVGTAVVIDADGPLAGQVGRIFKRGRTRYQVLTARGVVSVPAISVRRR